MQDIERALQRIPQYRDIPIETIGVQRLGGLTNLVYRLEVGGERLVLRIPGPGTEAYIDRAVEMHNAGVAAAADVSADVLYADPASGLLLTRCLDPVVTMTPAGFRERPGSPARAAEALRRLHESGGEFRFRFELFAMIDDYLGHLDRLGARLPEGYHDVVSAAEPVRSALAARSAELAPCHCDPLCENFLDDGHRMWIVDWEYSGMNDPLWDIGDLSVEAGFTEDQDAEMMQAYCGGQVGPAERARMVIYKAMCDLLWTLWGLIQHANDNPAEDFWAYSMTRFDRCKRLMYGPDFPAHLAALRKV